LKLVTDVPVSFVVADDNHGDLSQNGAGSAKTCRVWQKRLRLDAVSEQNGTRRHTWKQRPNR